MKNHRLPYYPFDFAFFAQKTPRRFPQRRLVEISTAPDPYPEIWTVID
jgi:hypothetical protein